MKLRFSYYLLTLVIFTGLSVGLNAQRAEYAHVFNPVQGMVKDVEKARA